MYFDAHGHLTQRLRYMLLAVAYPVQIAVNSPGLAWRWLTESFGTRAQLRSENQQLRSELHDLQLAAMREGALERENAELRGLRASLPALIKNWQLAEIIGVEADPLRQRIVIDKGAHAGVTAHQAVVDADGVLGQVERVGPWSSEVILLTDPAHEIPVQVTRNNLRSIALGNDGELSLPYLAANADVRTDDVLVSSGLGGVFPAGLPVARITGIRRESGQQPAQIHAQPLANVSRDREVIVLQFEPQNPDAPAAEASLAPLEGRTTAGAAAGKAASGAAAPHSARAPTTTNHAAHEPGATTRAPNKATLEPGTVTPEPTTTGAQESTTATHAPAAATHTP